MATPVAPQDLLFFLMEGRETPGHVGGLQLFEAPDDAGPHFVRELYEAAIHSDAPIRSLYRRRLVRPGGIGYAWEPDENLDLEYHLRHSALPEPGRIRELLALVSRLHGTLIDRNRPLWETHLIEGLNDGRFAMYAKIHHALVDGVTGMRLLQESLSEDPDERDMPWPWVRRADGTGIGEPSPASPADDADDTGADAAGSLLERLAAGLLTRAAGAVEAVLDNSNAVQSLIDKGIDQVRSVPSAPPSMLNVPVTGARRFAAQSWEIERVKAAGAHADATVNDMVLLMSAGALRRYLIDQDALPEESLTAMVPVSLKLRGEGDSTGNAVGAVVCSLGTHLEDPRARLDHIQESMRANKARLEGLSPSQIMILSGLAAAPMALSTLPQLLRRLPARPPFNVTISNVPGPRNPLYWNGARMSGGYPVSIATHGQALNITNTSYAGSLDFGIIGCRRAVPRLQNLLRGMEDELSALEAA